MNLLIPFTLSGNLLNDAYLLSFRYRKLPDSDLVNPFHTRKSKEIERRSKLS